MKILYGVVGEGMGHATRSRVILNHLVQRHELQIVVSGRAHAYLKQHFPDVIEIEGLRMTYENNQVDRSATFWDFLKRLPTLVSTNFDAFRQLSERFQPEAVVSDFESFAYMFGKHHGVPVISIDNMQVLNRCELDIRIGPEHEQDFQIAKGIVKSKLPGCYHYLITSFFFPPVRKERTSLYPPILRRRILQAERSLGEHLLVYQTSTSNTALLEILKATGVPCRVYGFGREERLGNVHLRPFSEDGFIEDLASCRGVLATGGFSLMGEAIYLGKPLLAVPLRKQFEQILNALYLEKLHYGAYAEELSAPAVEAFCERLEEYRQALASYAQDGNTLILGALDRLLGEVASPPRHEE
ncbi:MAG: teichoic acid biosynthesis protein [Deltaproteobacteria bacterium]|nr:teichoic acid biosynthesis protein [Deltaproteobacteria bacterium]